MSSEWDHIERHEKSLNRIAKKLVKLTKRITKIEKSLNFQQESLWDHELYSVHKNLTLEDKIDALVKVTRKNQDVLEAWEWRMIDMIEREAEGGEK